MTPAALRGPLGATIPNEALQHHQAFGVEFFITFVLLFTVFASTDSQRTDLGGSVPLTVGLSVSVYHLRAVSQFEFLFLWIRTAIRHQFYFDFANHSMKGTMYPLESVFYSSS